MQCPKCGFENMPGRQECAVCSAQFASSPKSESVMPPRAKDSSLSERFQWKWSRMRTVAVINDRINAPARFTTDRLRYTKNGAQISWSWLSLRNLWLLLISIIPGFGYIYGKKDSAIGARYFIAALGALLLAIITYKTYLADILLWTIAVMSVISIYSATDAIAPQMSRKEAHILSRAGISLFVISVVSTAVIVCAMALTGSVSMIRFLGQQPLNVIRQNDTLLLWNSSFPCRGDIVFDNIGGIGIVVGIPGDRVQIHPDGEAYLNNLVLEMPEHNPDMPTEENSILSFGDRTIPHGELLVSQIVPQTIMGNYNYLSNLREISSLVYIQRVNIYGRVVAVINPPAHRKIIRRDNQ